MNTPLEKRTELALRRIIDTFYKNGRVITGHSGGKDSVVIHDLVRRAGRVPYAVIHNVKPLLGTSNDPVAALTEMHPETLDFLYTNVCKDYQVQFMHSSKMQAYVATHGINCQIDGSRHSEHTRQGKSSQIIVNGKSVSREYMTDYIKNGIFGLNLSYPIFDWSDDDVFEYITTNKLAISDEYIKNGELAAYTGKHAN